ncbi:MAG: excisionase, partial [Lachnospiraceae bacterium]|nr:excisionase [Lachnospiraceae bacterium]
MQYTLMHKNTPVLDMKIDEETGRIAKLGAVHAAVHLPVGLKTFKTGIDRGELNEWWVGRSIPASRDGLKEALEKLGVPSSSVLISKCYGLSLSDQYWICPKDSGLTWDKVNFFTNDFSR